MVRTLLIASLLTLAACKSAPLVTTVTYEIIPQSEIPADIRRIAIRTPQSNTDIAGGTRLCAELGEMLASELGKKYLLVGPGKTDKADATISGRLQKLTILQRPGEHIVTSADDKGNPTRKTVADLRLDIDLVLTLELIRVVDGQVLAALRFNRTYRQTQPSGPAANRHLAAFLPRSDLATRVRKKPRRTHPGRAELLTAMLQQCAREFRRELVPQKETFDVRLLQDETSKANTAGLALMSQNLPLKAGEQFLEAVQSSARADIPWWNLGVAYEQQGRYLEALAAFRNAQRIRPTQLYTEGIERIQKYGG